MNTLVNILAGVKLKQSRYSGMGGIYVFAIIKEVGWFAIKRGGKACSVCV